MDEVFEVLLRFQDNLEQFNDNLSNSFNDLNKYHEAVAPHWQDNMRIAYDARWASLNERMKHYVTVEGHNYTDILRHKVQIIRRFLYDS